MATYRTGGYIGAIWWWFIYPCIDRCYIMRLPRYITSEEACLLIFFLFSSLICQQWRRRAAIVHNSLLSILSSLSLNIYVYIHISLTKRRLLLLLYTCIRVTESLIIRLRTAIYNIARDRGAVAGCVYRKRARYGGMYIYHTLCTITSSISESCT